MTGRRPLVVSLLVVIGCLAFTLAAPGVWARRNLGDTDAWVERAGRIIDDPAVQEPLSEWITTELMRLIDPARLFAEVLPERGRLLALPLAGAVEDFVGERVDHVVASDRFRRLWIAANEIAHRTAMRVLRGESDVVGTEGDRVVINLVPVIDEVLADIGAISPELFGRSIDIPDLSVQDSPGRAIHRLEQVFDVDLGAGFGQFTVYDRGRLKALQDGLQLARRLLFVLVVTTLVALALALWLSRRRRRTLLQTLAGLVIGLALVRRLAIRGQQELLASIRDDGIRGAALAVSDQFLDPLLAVTKAMLIGLAVVAAATLLSGPYPWAVRIRDVVATVGRDLAGAARRGGAAATTQAAGRAAGSGWVRTHRGALQLGGAVVVVLALLVLDLSFAGLALLAGLLCFYEAVLHEVPVDAGTT